MENLLSTKDVAKRLGMKHFNIEYLITTGAVPDAPIRLSGRRGWTEEAFLVLKEAVEKHKKGRKK